MLQVRVKVNENDTIGDLKRVVAAQSGHAAEKIRLQKWYNVFKDHVRLSGKSLFSICFVTKPLTDSQKKRNENSGKKPPIPNTLSTECTVGVFRFYPTNTH